MKKSPRLNWNAPVALVNEIIYVAESKNMEPSWWLRKVVEKALCEERSQMINLSRLESFQEK